MPWTGSATASFWKRPFMRNPEIVQAEHVETVPVMTDDRICFFTDTGSMYQVKAADVPAGKLGKDKGDLPLDNISRFEGAKERILLTMPASEFPGKKLLFATRAAMLRSFRAGSSSQPTAWWPPQSFLRATGGRDPDPFRGNRDRITDKGGHVPPVHDKRDPGA